MAHNLYAGVVLVALAGSLLLACPPEAGSQEEPGDTGFAEEPPPSPPQLEALFPTAPPLDVGDVPDGLANHSAQGCSACHYQAHDTWVHSAHASAWSSPAFQEAVAEIGSPACLACHLPLHSQQPDLVTYDEGDILRPITTPNPAWDGGLQTEGVTCAACHVREGAVITSRPVTDAPHPTLYSPELSTSTSCAACHQLTWPGADLPFYDTFGEWERSPQAAAGIQCQDCHLRSGVGEHLAVDHRFEARSGRGVSVLVRPATPDIARGGDPLPVTVILQNTGAGHAFPTGSPYVGVRLDVRLSGPPDRRGNPITGGEPFTVDLVRTLADEPPWNTVEDTRLQAGESREYPVELALPQRSPAGPWVVRVSLTRTVRGEPTGEPLVVREVPLRTD